MFKKFNVYNFKVMKKFKNLIALGLSASSTFAMIIPTVVLSSCTVVTKAKFENIKLEHNDEYGGINLKLSESEQKQFLKLFTLGDSVDLEFSNGTTSFSHKDVPLYNGYYAGVENLEVCAYPGQAICITKCSCEIDVWYDWNITDSTLLTVRSNQSGKYVKIQNALNFNVIYDQSKLTDEQWANFRVLKSDNENGKMKENLIYRSASPSNNQYKRAAKVSELMGQKTISYDINLSETKGKLDQTVNAEGFKEMSPYYYDFYQNHKDTNVYANHLLSRFYSQGWKAAIKEIATLISANAANNTFLIHCVEGKDRTGNVCTLLQMLCESNYEYMKQDFLTSFSNIFGADFNNKDCLYYTTKIYFISNVLAPICFPKNKEVEYYEPAKYEQMSSTDFYNYAKSYLTQEAGLTEAEVAALKTAISK